MAVSVQHDGMTITSSSDNADQVLAGLQAADAASQESKPQDAATGSNTPQQGATEPQTAIPDAAGSRNTPQQAAEGSTAESAEPVTDEPEPPQPRNRDGQFQSKHKKGSIQYRMDQKTWQAAEALRTLESERQERQRIQRELEDLRRGSQTPAPPAPKPPDPPDKPKIETWEGSYEDFVEAVADWKAEQKFKARDEQARHQAFMADRAQLGETFQQRKAEFAKTVADFDEVVDTDDISLSPVMCEALVTSTHGPAIAYYLGKHPEEAARLTQESERIPVSAAPLMQRDLEARATAFLARSSAPSASVPAQTRAVVRQAAPVPIKPVGSGLSVADTAPDDLPFGKEYVERMNARELAHAKGR